MSRITVCDGCGEFGPPITSFRDSELDYCAGCHPQAAAFYDAAMQSREKHVSGWRDELVELRAQHAPGLTSVPIPGGTID